jgi:hypothetical protein
MVIRTDRLPLDAELFWWAAAINKAADEAADETNRSNRFFSISDALEEAVFLGDIVPVNPKPDRIPVVRYLASPLSDGTQIPWLTSSQPPYDPRLKRPDVLRWLEKRGELPNQWAHYLEKSNPLSEGKTQRATETQIVLTEAGKRNAALQHADRCRLYGEVREEVRQLWKNGDPRLHSDMAQHFKSKHPSLSLSTLRKNLADLARDMERQDLIRGLKKKG